MRTEPDGLEVVGTAEQALALAQPPLLVLESLREYFDERGLGAGELAWQRIGEGQANLTYLIRRGDDAFVVRRGPRPPHPPSTHDMVREARIQRLLAAHGVPVPNIVSVCEDPTVLGVPFYVMDYLDGVVLTDRIPDALSSPQQRRATSFAAVDALVELHALDVSHGDLASIGRADKYLERQLRRFTALWDQVSERSVPEVQAVGGWLHKNIPTSQRDSVVHGDYRMGNLMYRHRAPAQVSAILDWEMATLGDPLADLGYFTATYASSQSPGNVIELTPITREPGYPSRQELIERYAKATGLDVSGIVWYQVLALWKAAIFCEAIYVRWCHGQRPGDTFAPTLADGIPQMIMSARTLIDQAMTASELV